MLVKRDRGPGPDPEEWLEGVCASCKRVVGCRRWETVRPNEKTRDGFNDGVYTGCECGARVYVFSRVSFVGKVQG